MTCYDRALKLLALREHSRKELENKLKEVLNELSPKDCDLYISIKICGEKESNLAKKLGVSRNAIHKKIVRISKFVEEKLKSFID